MTETRICGVVLPVDIAQRARVVAALENKSRSRLMRDLLESHLQTYAALDANEDAKAEEVRSAGEHAPE